MERAYCPDNLDLWRLKRLQYIVVDRDGKLLFISPRQLRKYHRAVGSVQKYRYEGFINAGCKVYHFTQNVPLTIRRVDENNKFLTALGGSEEESYDIFATRIIINGKIYDLVDDESVNFYTIFSKRTRQPRAFVIKIYKPERTLRKFVIKL